VKFPVADVHNDTLLQFMQGFEGNACPALDWSACAITPQRLLEGGVAMSCFAICQGCLPHLDPVWMADRMIEMYHKMVRETPAFLPVFTYADVERALLEGKVAAVLAMEGMEACVNAAGVQTMYDKGVRIASLAWNRATVFADGMEGNLGRGVTAEGKKAIGEMERLGMVLDVSHLTPQAFWDVVEIAQKPFLATHSNAKKLCGHGRNLDDSQLVALARAGGVAGVNFYTSFLVDEGAASEADLLAHIDYISGHVGSQHVGIGTDYDGCGSLPQGCEDPRCFPRLAESLLRLGYAEDDVRGIMGGNNIRVCKAVWREG